MLTSLAKLGAIFAIAVSVVGLGGRTESYKYKLTLAVDTPAGEKRASSVVEVTFYEVSVPGRGIMHRLRGEAVYLDLGPGAKPLIALLTQKLHPPRKISEIRWTRDAGPGLDLLAKLNGQPLSDRYIDDVPRIAQMRKPQPLSPGELPNLVTFADTNDPASVIEVDPNNLSATLGPNIAWREIILESTDEPVTASIGAKLPWLAQYYGTMLDGQKARNLAKRTLPNSLNTADFQSPTGLR